VAGLRLRQTRESQYAGKCCTDIEQIHRVITFEKTNRALSVLLKLVLITLILIMATEFVGQQLFRQIDNSRVADAREAQENLPAFADATYRVGELGCGDAVKVIYSPYILSKRVPCKAELTNIDRFGRRVTTGNSTDADAQEIWLFGGSTAWGSGVPDGLTITSGMAQQLNGEFGVNSRVTNFGENSYVSTQELISLIRELQMSDPPDVVVFYDGANDSAVGALWPSPPGSHWDLDLVSETLMNRRYEGFWGELIEGSAFLRAAKALQRRIGIEASQVADEDSIWGYRTCPSDARRCRRTDVAQFSGPLSNVEAALEYPDASASDIWLKNYRIATALGGQFGFEVFFFFQPTLGGGEKVLDESEVALLADAQSHDRWGPMIAANISMRKEVFEDPIAVANPNRILDIGDVMTGVGEPVYYDPVHTNGRGYQLVADEIVRSLIAGLCGDPDDLIAADQFAEDVWCVGK
jgi:lysophospholipase L1-like esterase